MYTVTLTKEEMDAVIIQIGGRIEELKELQKEAASKQNVARVIELETFMKPIYSAKEKLMDARYHISKH